jgi:hypothetical protein
VFRVGVCGKGKLVRSSGVEVEGRDGLIASEGRIGVESVVCLLRSVGRGCKGESLVDSSSQGFAVRGDGPDAPLCIDGVRGTRGSNVDEEVGVAGCDPSRVESLLLISKGGDPPRRVEERRLLTLGSPLAPSPPS